jgi:hypothetical protein
MLASLRRLLTRPDGIPGVTGHGITGSVSPLPVRGLDVNPRSYPCCDHCTYWQPADCPVTHDEPCVECSTQDAS